MLNEVILNGRPLEINKNLISGQPHGIITVTKQYFLHFCSEVL